MTPEDTEPRAAVAIVHASEGEESVLLIRRTEREGDPWSGHWSFPGGRRDDEDAGPLETALRELEEECGIRLGREHLERALEPMNARRRVGKFLLVAPFVFRVGSRLPAVPEPREAVEAVWVPLSILRDPSRHSLRAVPGLPEEMRYPAIGLGEVPLWGFTYRLIAEWLGLGPQTGATRLWRWRKMSSRFFMPVETRSSAGGKIASRLFAARFPWRP